jgi:hypothetical protein
MQPREMVAAVMGWNWESDKAEAVEAIMRSSPDHLENSRLS